MAKHIIWGIVVLGCVSAIAVTTRDFNIEDVKQRAFMMKACVDAGGTWEKSGWTMAFECKRRSAT